MESFYRSTFESLLAYCISVWYSGCIPAEKRALQRIINTAQIITGCSLPSLEDIASPRHLSRTNNIIKDTSHPDHHLFALLSSGIRYRS
ncbi:mas-related G-protein coupled receptor member A4-like [Tachysurus ichikawai]